MKTVVKIKRGNKRTSLPVEDFAEGVRRVAMINAEHESKVLKVIGDYTSDEVIDGYIAELASTIAPRPIAKVLMIPSNR